MFFAVNPLEYVRHVFWPLRRATGADALQPLSFPVAFFPFDHRDTSGVDGRKKIEWLPRFCVGWELHCMLSSARASVCDRTRLDNRSDRPCATGLATHRRSALKATFQTCCVFLSIDSPESNARHVEHLLASCDFFQPRKERRKHGGRSRCLDLFPPASPVGRSMSPSLHPDATPCLQFNLSHSGSDCVNRDVMLLSKILFSTLIRCG